VQHGLVKVSYAMRKAGSLLTRNEVEIVNKAAAKVLEWKMVYQVLHSIFLKMKYQY